MDEFIRRYLRFQDNKDCLVCETTMLRNLQREIATERDRLRTYLTGVSLWLAEEVKLEANARAVTSLAIGDRDSARFKFADAFNRLRQLRQWLV